MSLASRLKRLEAKVGREDEPCPGETTVVVYWSDSNDDGYYKGFPTEPTVPADAKRCQLCGEPHPLFIRLIGDDNWYGNGDRLAEIRRQEAR
jgi:hypothetical protein